MPAAPSSLTGPAIGQLLTAAQALGPKRARLLPVLAAVPDPQARRGVRHQLAVILSLALCAVLAGARSFTAIAEWAADADQATREALGVTGVVPCESTFRRTLQNPGRGRRSPPCWTASTWPARWSPQTLCTPSAPTRITWSPSAARIT